MPVFGLCKEGFDPDLALVESPLIGKRLGVASHSFEVASMERAMHLSTSVTGSTLGLEWTRITGHCLRAVFRFFCLVLHPREMQRLTVGADVEIVRGVIGELGGSIIRRHMLPIRQRDVGANALIFQSLDVLDGSVFGVAGGLARPQMPSEADMPKQIKHWLVVHHLGGGNQRCQNDAPFASINDVVGMVAQVKSTALEAHRRGIRVSGTDPLIGATLIEPMNFALLSTFLPDPVVLC